MHNLRKNVCNGAKGTFPTPLLPGQTPIGKALEIEVFAWRMLTSRLAEQFNESMRTGEERIQALPASKSGKWL
jgi:hypothetical protein